MKTIIVSLSAAALMSMHTTPALAAESTNQPGNAGGAEKLAARQLIARILPKHARLFDVELIPPDEGRDVFELESRGDRLVIRGNNAVSVAMGLNWYLKHHCQRHHSLFGRNLDLPELLPTVKTKVRRAAWAQRRYFLNYCCFGYSLPWWDWEQWEALIDWMALNGVNMPLAVTGQEATWQGVCRKLGLTEAEIAGFLAGPPFLPFQWMGCLDGWGGPLPQGWIDRHAELQNKILASERELGMTPVLQGFTGHVPPALAHKFPKAKLQSIRWIEWETRLLDPLDPLFPRLAKIFMEEQTRRFGTDHLYAADTFIEMTPPSGDAKYLAELGRAIYAGQTANDPQAVWVLQGWAFMFNRSFWTQPRIRAFLDALPDERMIVLDLFCETTPMWNQTEAFCGKPWVWCNIENFGCTVHLGGALSRINQDLHAARQDPGKGRLAGLGFVNEGLGYNPVVYDLMFEMAWRDEPVDLEQWIVQYARHRYGWPNASAEEAWRILLETAHEAPNRTRSIIDHMPTLGRVGGLAPYDNHALSKAWQNLLLAAHDLGATDTYRFDLVNVARQVLSNHAAEYHRRIAKAWQAKDAKAFAAESRRFLQLIRDLDELTGTRQEFLLGRCLEAAKRWGATPEEKARFEWNARRVLTAWGEGPAIDDYARKEWSGMLNGYYLQRWEMFLKEVGQSLQAGQPYDEKAVKKKLREWMLKWSDQTETYPIEPKGDSVRVAGRLWQTYSNAFRPEAVSLTTGKPVSCSHALAPFPARLANDGHRSDTDRYWATDVTQNPQAWWQVDLDRPAEIARVVVVCFFGDRRFYGFTVETSLDGKTWKLVADRRDNKELSTAEGYDCRFEPHRARYIRVTQTSNSANTGRHLVEVIAFKE